MPKTHVKKRIKMQYTRKNDIRGGAVKVASRGDNEPMRFGNRFRKGIARAAKAINTSVQFDAKLKYPNKINIDIAYIKRIFNINKPGEDVDNYKNYESYTFNNIDILIENKNKSEPNTPCMQGEFKINGLIWNKKDKQLLLVIKHQGYSAVFHSSNFDFFTSTK